MERGRNRLTENLVYGSLWLVAVGIYMLDVMRGRAEMAEPLMDWWEVKQMVRTFLPFIILFGVNNDILIPKLLLRNRLKFYFLSVGLLLAAMWVYQYWTFIHFFNSLPPLLPPKHPSYPRSLLPMPLLLDFTCSLFVLGANLAVTLLFQRFKDKFEQESLMKANAENELAYLKAQINPHFYMNMLNNIHAMIEIDPEKAQVMVIDMSQLMRYMLYDSSQTRIPLANEIAFLQNYIRIMRRRFPENRVIIHNSFPTDNEVAGIEVPPLLSLVFIENAFKHGISYRNPSFVDVSMTLSKDRVNFRCVNSRHADGEDSKGTGIGLRNIRHRLELIYGAQSSLNITENENEYLVDLSIPI